MKKMVPLVIFLVVLIALVCVGCANFSTVITGDETGGEVSSADVIDDVTGGYVPQEGETELVPLDVPVTDALGEVITDEEGQWVTTRQYFEVPVADAPQSVPAEQQNPAEGNSRPTSPAGETTTAAPHKGTAEIPQSGATEYDILRSGNFYMKGTMNDGSETLPLEVGVTANTIYMTSEMDGIQVAILVDAQNKVYMMINEKKVYLELSDAVMKYMGVSAEELVSSDSVDFSKYQPLDKANEVNDTTLNGVACKEYVFKAPEGETRVYMNGSKLLRFASFSSSGAMLSASDVTAITSNVPADKTNPPEDYKGYKGVTGFIGFMSQLTDLM